MFEIKVVPADDAVLDQAVASLGDLLVFLVGLDEFAWGADGDIAGKSVCQFDAAELLLNGLSQVEIVDVTQDKQ